MTPDLPTTREQLLAGRCVARPAAALTDATIATQLRALPGWRRDDEGALTRTFPFDDYRTLLAFVNAVADLAINQDHHPEIRFDYACCQTRWITHSVNGISVNDFICAALTDAVLSRMPRLRPAADR